MTEWRHVPDSIEGYQGFVYIIKNKVNGMYYIGKKFFWSKKTKPPLKGKKRKRRFVVESNWKDYWGSSNKLLADIEKYGKESFTRTIIMPCKTKFECAYVELQYQMDYDVLFDEKSYNGIINVRLMRKK